MCVLSMVFDQYQPLLPKKWTDLPTWKPPTPKELADPSLEARVKALEELVKELKEAIKLAKQLDAVTHQPDCEDPEKAKLLDRIKKLEAEIKKFKASKKSKKK